MSPVPSLSYRQVVAALGRAGFLQVRQKGSHIRMEKSGLDGTVKITVPAHRPIKRTTLARIIRDAGLTLDEFLDLA